MTTNTAVEAPAAPSADARFELVPLDRLVESPSNHRRRSWGDMNELAASIRAKGVLEPILIRPGRGIGSNLFEIVFGHRRFRGAKTAGLKAIPAMVRGMTDLEVVEAQVIENLQRQDVHALEEAEGYEQLLASKERAYTVDDIAAKVGKSKAYVYGRLKLLALCAEARKAFYEKDELSPSVALLIARIPVPELQQKALEEVLEGDEYGDLPGPMSFRDAQEHILHRYTLRLADAPFDRGDAALVAGAGKCTTCPKRTGAQPELFADVKSADVCTDPRCFAEKKEAAWKQRSEEAKASGMKVLTAKETTKVFDRYGGGTPKYDSPYVDLSAPCLDDPKRRPWKQLLGKAAPEKVLARDPHGKVHELVDREAAREAAKKAGVKLPVRPETGRSSSHDPKEYERKERLRREVQRRVAAAVVERFERVEPDAKLWRIVAGLLAGGYDNDHAFERRFGAEPGPKVIDAAIAKMTEAQLRGFVLELALVPALYFGPYDTRGESKDLLAWAKVDVKAIEKAVREDLKAQETAAAKKPGPGELAWRNGRGNGIQVADVAGGHYELESNMGRWNAVFVDAKGTRKILLGGTGGIESDAKKACQQHHIERAGDALLANAGAGELTKKALKGPAVAPKRGGRRG